MQNEAKSVASMIFSCFRANKILMALVPCCLLVTGISSYLNITLTDSFSDTNREYSNSNFDAGFKMLKNCLLIMVLHYFFAQISTFISQKCAILVFRAFLCESVSKYADLDYSEFHSKGSAKIQDNINRSSRAAKEITYIVTFEIPKSIIDFYLAYWGIHRVLSDYYFSIFTCTFGVCIIIAFLIAIFCFKSEKENILLYKKSFIPLADILHNFDIIKAFNNEEKENRIYKRSLDPFMINSNRYFIYKNILLFIQKSTLALPQFFIYYSTSVGEPVWRSRTPEITIIMNYNKYYTQLKKEAIQLRDHVFKIIKETAEMKTDATIEIKTEQITLEKKSFDYQIRLSDVDLYAGSNIVQKKQSFVINKGDKIAVTGTNGSGKTVFAKALMKFFRSEGEFCIDDVPINKISAKSLRNLIAYAPQDPHILNNTVLYNLGYSQKNIDERQIYEYCQEFGLHEFFKSMKDGYNTEAGEKGKYLSGGQKQRISFMRAVIKDAPIIIMDEPTANIDRASEIEMMKYMLKHSKDKTVLIIAHSHELLKEFDKILYFTKEGVTYYDSYDKFISNK